MKLLSFGNSCIQYPVFSNRCTDVTLGSIQQNVLCKDKGDILWKCAKNGEVIQNNNRWKYGV